MLVMQLMSPPSALAAPTDPTQGGNSESFSELTEWAETHRGAGEYATSARAFAAAYAQLTEHEQGGLEGDITVNNAIDDFRLAQEQDSEDIMLLVDELALLELFGEHPTREHDMPPEITEEIARIAKRIDSLERAWEAKATPKKPVEDQPHPGRKLAGTLLGIGLASIGGGAALTTNGLWNIHRVDRRGAELLATIAANHGGSLEMRNGLRERVEDWQDAWYVVGTRLAISGGALAAIGIGLTTWGAVRMHRARRRSLAGISPIMTGRGVSIALTWRY